MFHPAFFWHFHERLSTDRIMDGSRVIHSLDSLWFYTNILTCRYEPVASLTDQFEPSILAKEPPERDSQKPNTPLFLLNQHCESQSQNVENTTPMCHKCGESSPAFEEMVRKSGRETEKRERRKWSKFGLNGTEVILGGLDLGFNVKEVGGFLRFQEKSFDKYKMLGTQQQTKMPPFDDDVAMKQHLKSWAYAVALHCMHCQIKQIGR